jgi:hypothetical protein
VEYPFIGADRAPELKEEALAEAPRDVAHVRDGSGRSDPGVTSLSHHLLHRGPGRGRRPLPRIRHAGGRGVLRQAAHLLDAHLRAGRSKNEIKVSSTTALSARSIQPRLCPNGNTHRNSETPGFLHHHCSVQPHLSVPLRSFMCPRTARKT